MEGTCPALLHAIHEWLKVVHVSLWPLALKNYSNLHNAIPTRFTPGVKNKNVKQPVI